MSEQVARAHTSASNRAKARENADRKIVFKSVVDNPFRVQWPTVPFNIQNTILSYLVEMLPGVAEYNLSRERVSRAKRKHSRPSGRASKKVRRASGAPAEPDSHSTPTSAPSTAHEVDVNDVVAVIPPIIDFLAVGINEVTKRLENLASSHRRVVDPDNVEDGESVAKNAEVLSAGRLVVACRADVDPPALIGHIPNLVAACNSRRDESRSLGPTWLVSVPKGSEHTLAEALGLRRAAVMLIDNPESHFPGLGPVLQGLPLLAAPWLESPLVVPAATLVPTHIKQLRTTAPKDMRSAKEQRARRRAAAKEHRRTNAPTIPQRVTLT